MGSRKGHASHRTAAAATTRPPDARKATGATGRPFGQTMWRAYRAKADGISAAVLTSRSGTASPTNAPAPAPVPAALP